MSATPLDIETANDSGTPDMVADSLCSAPGYGALTMFA
jgi:hypothetical protein